MVIMLKDKVGMSAACLMLMIVGEIGESRKFCVDRVTAEMIIGVITRMAVKEMSRSSSRNTRSRSRQQQNCQEKKGAANSNRSISLKVLVGDVNYKS
ncbi:hypothetical protein TNCV_3282161 [Trichonephila clavipes]|nr:hypothetical protein TNCV_3282161 [Trichonephila clavipes]